MNGIEEYYARRAREYEQVYLKPERQTELSTLRERLATLLRGETVLEIACGTGWWTQCVSESVRWIVATDFNHEVIRLASMKYYPRGKVCFCRMDAYHPAVAAGYFTGGLAGFWYSHISRQNIRTFVEGFHRFLKPGSRVVWLDNKYVEGSSTPISRIDAEGNTYQVRPLSGGHTYEIMKNFPGEKEALEVLDGIADQPVFEQTQYYWLLHYRCR